VGLVHVDTDIGSAPDHLCAIAMLLGWRGVELAGVTTSSEVGGMRAGLASYALRLAGGKRSSWRRDRRVTRRLPLPP
jgi:hypothetical protein